MDDQGQQDVSVRDNPDKSRFDVLVGDTHAGFSMYKDLEATPADPSAAGAAAAAAAAQRIFYHTVVFDEFGGRGLAGILTRTALGTSVETGHRIVAVCPYVKKWLTTHHDFDDAADPANSDHLKALR